MEIKKAKATSLYMLFLKYLAAFFFFTMLLIAINFVAFNIALNSGFILSANYAEQVIQQMKEQIAESETFDDSLVPFPCNYVLIDENGTIISTDMSQKEAKMAQEALMKSGPYSKKQYLSIQREDSSCIISYDLYAHFSSPFLHKWLPNPEILEWILFFTEFLAIAVMIALAFGRKLKAELVPIIVATDAIKRQELHWEAKPTKIREFNVVLDSIESMSAALESSLKQQWDMEQNRKMQMAAITHDIKTPLTIIKGNTELLLESEQVVEDKELLEYIRTSSDKVERYLGMLMAATRAENEDDFHPGNFSIRECVREIEMQAKAHCMAQKISLVTQMETIADDFFGDRELIVRAVSNILDNAIEHTPGNGKIKLEVIGKKDTLSFGVTDTGNGFSQNSLKSATQQFYTEHGERSGKHYGLGLFIAKSVAQKHKGELLLANRQGGCGAEVTLILRM